MGKGIQITIIALLTTVIMISTATAVPYTNSEPIRAARDAQAEFEAKMTEIEALFASGESESLMSASLLDTIDESYFIEYEESKAKEESQDQSVCLDRASLALESQESMMDLWLQGLIDFIYMLFIACVIIIIHVGSISLLYRVFSWMKSVLCLSNLVIISYGMVVIMTVIPVLLSVFSIAYILIILGICSMAGLSKIMEAIGLPELEFQSDVGEWIGSLYAFFQKFSLPNIALFVILAISYLGDNLLRTGRFIDAENSFMDLYIRFWTSMLETILEIFDSAGQVKLFENLQDLLSEEKTPSLQ